jgi:hypothetical protein
LTEHRSRTEEGQEKTMESVIQQLLAIEATLKGWIGTDNCAAFLVDAQNDAEHIPAYAQGASSASVAAGLLFSIETAAQSLREHLNVPLTVVSQVMITSITLEPAPDPSPE